MRFPILTALTFTILGFASTSPLVPRHDGCRPNLAGVTVSIVNPASGLEWAIISEPTELLGALLVGHAVSGGHDSEFKFGGAPSSGPYTIAQVQDPTTDLFVQPLAGDTRLHLFKPAPNERWDVRCKICHKHKPEPRHQRALARGCTIRLENGGPCVTLSDTGERPLTVTPCSSSASQIWDLF